MTDTERIFQIQQQLHGLADQLEREFVVQFGISVLDRYVIIADLQFQLYNKFIEDTIQLLIAALDLDGFQADKVIRTTIQSWRRQTPREIYSKFGHGLVNFIQRRLRQPRQRWSYKYIIYSVHIIAERMLMPYDNTAHIRKKHQKDRYRLPREQRTVASPYIEVTESNSAGEFWSLEVALQQPEKVRRLYVFDESGRGNLDGIENLINLQHLRIRNLKPLPLPKGISRLRNLVSIYAERRSIDRLPDNIGDIASLEYLYFAGNAIRNIPQSIGQLSRLRTLNLYSNGNLLSVPASITQLKRLHVLVLSNCPIREIPDDIGNCSELRQLDLSFTELTQLPDSIEQLTQLRELDLSGNGLRILPDGIGEFKHLEKLYLDHNKLDALPENIANLTRLRELSITENSIGSLPKRIGNLKNLCELSLMENPLTTLPESIGNLRYLKEIRLDSQRLIGIPASLGDISDLQEIEFSNSQLTELPATLAQLKNLRILTLNGSQQLTRLPGGIKVDRLSVANCPRLKELPSDLKVTDSIELAHSGLTSLPERLRDIQILWDGVQIDARIAFSPERITIEEALGESHPSLRRVLMTRIGYTQFMETVWFKILDRGERQQLLHIITKGEAAQVYLESFDPLSGEKKLIQVPAATRTCQQATAWIAGFDNPDKT